MILVYKDWDTEEKLERLPGGRYFLAYWKINGKGKPKLLYELGEGKPNLTKKYLGLLVYLTSSKEEFLITRQGKTIFVAVITAPNLEWFKNRLLADRQSIGWYWNNSRRIRMYAILLPNMLVWKER